MNHYDELRKAAKARRDQIINAARAEYRDTVIELVKLRARIVKKASKPVGDRAIRTSGRKNFNELCVAEALLIVLRDDGPKTLVEVTVEIQRRGCRASDDPRRVAHAVRSSLLYHKHMFKQDRVGRWSVVQ